MQDGLGCEESFLLASFPSVGIQARGLGSSNAPRLPGQGDSNVFLLPDHNTASRGYRGGDLDDDTTPVSRPLNIAHNTLPQDFAQMGLRPQFSSSKLPLDSDPRTIHRGNRRDAAIRRNRTCQKCSPPHGERLYRLVGFGPADVKARMRLIFMLEKDSIGPIHGLFEALRRFPRRGRTGTFRPRKPRKTQPGSLFSPGTARAKTQSGNL